MTKPKAKSAPVQKPIPAPTGPLIINTNPAALEAEKFVNEDAGVVTASPTGGLEIDAPDVVIEEFSSLADLDERASELAFLEEPVTLNIAEGTDQLNPEPYVFLAVNGVGAGPDGIPYVPRGQNVTIKRKYLAVLALARPSSYSSVEKVDPDTGERRIEYPRKSGLKYPFTVIEDKNPKGSTWLRKLLTENRV